MIFDAAVFPFKSLKNFFKSAFIFIVVVYIFASLFVIVDYITENYGYIGKFMCFPGVFIRENKSKVVRVVGGLGEGSGFFITSDKIITNFHVIDGEDSPKIIFPDGRLVTPIKLTGDRSLDLAVLQLGETHPDLVIQLNKGGLLGPNEPLYAIGYPMGTDIIGEATILKGKFDSIKNLRGFRNPFVISDINIVKGMSGGPLLEACGKVVGINTLGVGGISMFISSYKLDEQVFGFSDSDIKKVDLNPAESPEDAVFAFYTYIGARNMEEGYKLLSAKYREKTEFEEWSGRFSDIIDVRVYLTELEEGSKDSVLVKFSTSTWNNPEVTYHFYEGTWVTVEEEGVYKMNKSSIKEVLDPGWDWFYGV